jgi:hypothetical protein
MSWFFVDILKMSKDNLIITLGQAYLNIELVKNGVHKSFMLATPTEIMNLSSL